MKKMIKTKFRIFSFLLILLAAFFAATFSSCENAITDEPSELIETQQTSEVAAKPETSNKGSIQIRINPDQIAGSSSRTVLPEISYDTITRVVLSGTHNGSTRTLQEWSSYYDVDSVLIELGSWDLNLTVVNNGKTFTSNTVHLEVVSGYNSADFTLTTSSTEGGISLQIDFTGDAVAARYRILSFPSDTELDSGNLSVTTSPSKSVTYVRDAANNPIANGTYRVEINFYGDAARTILLNTYSEIVRVKGGFTSSASRNIDLNNLYHITYEANGGTIQSGSFGEYYSLHSTSIYSIDLPVLRRTGYEFDGWFKDNTFTDGPYTSFDVSTESSLGEKYYYAKWNRVCAITYYIAAEGFTSESECIELTEDQCDEWGLSQSHTAGSATQLPLSPVVNENSIPITLAGYTLSSLSGTALTSNGSNYMIPASVSTDTSIYLHVKSHIAYIDPSIESETNNLPFNPSTPAKTVAGALKWLKNADSDKSPVLYVKSTISNKTDIENLSDLSSPAASGGLYGAAIVKRHSSYTNGSLLSITENLTLQNVTLDGGAVWSKTQTEIEADPELLVTRTNSGLSSSIYLISTGTATGTATFEGVTIQNVDNTATTSNGNGAAVYINSGTLTLTNCHIKDCRSIRGALFVTTAGTINAVNTRFLCNNSIGSGSDKGHGGAVYLYGGATSGGEATFDACSFQYNAANAFGGAVYVGNNGKATFKNQGSNSLANNFSDMATAAASRTCKGDFIYSRGRVTLLGDFAFGTGANALTFYIDNASSWHTITLGDSFGGASTTGTAKIYLSDTLENSVNQPILSVVFGDSSVNMANAKMHFALAGNDGNYLIDDNGLIKLIPGTLTITPGFPDTYVCKWKQRVSGTTRYIDLIIEDLDEHALEIGTAVGNINSVTAGIYEGADLVKEYTLTSATGLSFAYPSYLDPPSGTPFYVRFNVKVDDTTAYSYDYWPEQIWMGSKTPDQAKNVGDIVFNDGSAEPYVEGMTISDEQKAAAIALIFYKGTDLNSDNDDGSPDTTTLRTLGVGLKHNSLAWCTSSAAAYNNNITTIQCTIDGSVGSFTFAGDKNGSDNLEQIAAFLADENDTGVGLNSTKTEAEAADLYPAFYFARNYKNFPGSNVGGTDFENNWYLPSLPELYQIYANGKGTGKVFDIDAVSQALGGDQFGSDVVQYYRPSTQSSSFSDETRIQNFGDGDYGNHSKLSILSLCCIREF